MARAVGFLLVTYVPLQAFALWRQRRGYRIATAAPLLVMVPVIAGACTPGAYRDGSLFGMNYIFFYLPSMLYLTVAAISPPKLCPQCGRPISRRSFQRTPAVCRHCEDVSRDPAKST
jgi:hypothetical protein